PDGHATAMGPPDRAVIVHGHHVLALRVGESFSVGTCTVPKGAGVGPAYALILPPGGSRLRAHFHTPGPRRCNWPWTGADVSYQGLAMPCCMVATPDRIHLGDRAERGADAVWNGPDYQGFRAALSSDSPPEVCRSCAIDSGTS